MHFKQNMDNEFFSKEKHMRIFYTKIPNFVKWTERKDELNLINLLLIYFKPKF